MPACANGIALRMLKRILLFFIISVSLAQTPLRAEEFENEIQVVADDLQYSKNDKKIVATGNVVVTQGNVQLSSDRAEVQVETKEAEATGHVIVRQRGAGTLSGDKVTYNFESGVGSFDEGKFFNYPWYGKGEALDQTDKETVKLVNARITSCDLPNPHYALNAGKATLYAGDKIVAWNVTFRILDVPVFWWPYLVIPLDYSLGSFSPGYSDEFGGYIRTDKGFSLSKNIKGKFLFDWYSKRGFGIGTEVDYKFKKLGMGEVKLYGIKDNEAPDQEADNPFANKNRDDRDRGRLSWKHKSRIDSYTTLQLQWHELSDDVFLQDFFEGEHREEIDPQSFITLTRNSHNYSLLTHVEKRTNRFQSVHEKLPEIAFTWLRKPLFGTNFYYTNEEGFINLKETKAFQPEGAKTIQLYTDHELSYPMRFLKFYNFIPFINFREDIYTEGRTKEEKISRSALGLGFDANTKFYRAWDYTGKPLGIEINGVRHVLEPIIQYNAIKIASVEPTRLINTGRGDDIDHQDIMTFGVENRIQTRRGAGENPQHVDVVSFNTFLDLSFGPGSDLISTTANKFIEARVETTVRPYDWLQVRDNAIYDFVSKTFTSNTLDLSVEIDRLNLVLAHRFSNPRGGKNDNEFTISGDYALNDKWTIGSYLQWEATKNTVEEWEIRARRDLHDWLLDFGFNVRNSDRTDEEKELNKELFVELKLKALEDIRLSSGHRASFSEPRIGKSVAGANEAPLPSNLERGIDSHHVAIATP
jgi:hypothetical protein